MPRASAAPTSTGQQVPTRWSRLQATQPPWQATLQQTPSAQKPLAHSAPPVHVAPFIFGPQLPPTHWWPLEHWELTLQVSKQLPVAVLQVNGAQISVGLGLQRPLPSQA